MLDTEHFEKILETVNRRFNIEGDAEISAECNPGTVDVEKLRGMRRAGVNRLSIGLQSVQLNKPVHWLLAFLKEEV